MLHPYRINVENFKWEENSPKFDKSFTRNCNKTSDKGYIPEVDSKHLKELHKAHYNLSFLPEGLKVGKCNKFACNLHTKEKLRRAYENFESGTRSCITIRKKCRG